MKSNNLSCILVVLVMFSILTGCQQKNPKVGVLIHSYENERWDKDKQYLVENLNALGAEVMLEVADNIQSKQIEQAQAMIDQGVQVLIVVPINQDEAAQIVEIAHDADVKVIAYDRLINGCKLDYYVSANSTQIGEIQASYLASLKPHGIYTLICGSKYDNNASRLFIGQMNALQPYMERGDIQVLYSEFTENWSSAEGTRHANQILSQIKDSLTAIIVGNDALADGVLAVLKENGLEGKVMVAGQDAELDNCKAIIAGNQTCTVLKPLREMARSTAELAVLLASDKPINMNFTMESNGKALVKSLLLNSMVVNKNNMDNTIISSGYHTAAELN
jgi:D-xylose transport system substrate-binding protein